MKIHLLFICTANENRSPAAEALFGKSKDYEAKSCGINSLSKIPVSAKTIEWADIIMYMEKMHKKYILQQFPKAKHKKMTALEIPDIYLRDDPWLIQLLKNKLEKIDIIVKNI